MEQILEKLVSKGIVDKFQIEKAKIVASQKNKDILKIIVEINPEKEAEIFKEVSLFYQIPYLELKYIELDKDAAYLLAEEFVRKNNIVPLFKIKDWLFVGFGFPVNYSIINEIKRISSLNVKACLISDTDVQVGIDKTYRSVSSAEKIVQKIGEMGEDIGASVVQLVNLLVAQAVRDRASDIHVEPDIDKLRIRFRIDGVMQEVPSPPKSLEMALISRIKVMADLDIAESRLPQDGHLKLNVDGKEIDVRVSTIPTVNGENVVMRILDTADVLLGLEKLGFGENSLELFKKAIAHPYGMILTTGPTGSGKTTTLYSALMELNTIDKHIITIEDPVEYRLPLIRQIQLNAKAGLNFSSGLRSILRHDPDIIMVGEIRDLDAATIAVQSALTGHLVFSTLHTNDAASAVTRLVNMGVEAFLISASLVAVMAQRLARKICPECKKSYHAKDVLIEKFGFEKSGKHVNLYKGEGCDFCKGTGYWGRIGLFEIMLIDDEIREYIIANKSVVEIRELARKKGMKTLFEDGIEKALKGAITIDEVSRVCDEIVEIKKKPLLEYTVAPYFAASEGKKQEELSKEKKPKVKDIESYTKKIMNWISTSKEEEK